MTTELSSRTPEQRLSATAAVWAGLDDGFTVGPQPLPELAPGEVLVRVEMATVCGSDLHTLAGDRPTPLPTVLGHEAVGVVEATGGTPRLSDGTPLLPGRRVTWTIGTSCGACRPCSRGASQKCVHVRKYGHEEFSGRWRLNGGLATHCHLAEGTGVVAVPDELPAEVAAPVNCATATVVCAARRAGLAAGDTVVVTGCGMLGLTAVAYARDQGARHVLACDVDPARRAAAVRFGATASCAPEELPEAARRFGADVVLELSGSGSAVQTALDIVGLDGSVALVGSVSPGPEVRIEPNAFVRNLSSVVGCHNYRVDDLAEAVAFVARTPHRELLAGLVSRPFALEDIDGAVAAAREGTWPRVAVRMT
ncbi:zinc-binding dehydrogenase [Streptomyces sp. NPDC048172]|uniref:zinc-binding dehydrogenase n=1 Tax=Streptomyces sp. NPDC048172 TaxID=3365505 RepID=UPI0037130035